MGAIELEARVFPPARDGGSFIFDAPTVIPSLWGAGEGVVWAEGEPLMIAGGDGAGKTTIAQQLILRRVGVLVGPLLGMDVVADSRPVFYLAMDRPRQAGRSFRRMVSTPEQRAMLSERLLVQEGPLPYDVLSEPGALAEHVQSVGAGTLVIDSLKDLATGLSSDETGALVNRAVQSVIAGGSECLILHHQRKATSENKSPNSLADIYGSRWLTAGCGSVLFIEGEAGAETVQLLHLKQPGEPVGPIAVRHNHTVGESHLLGAGDDPDRNEAALLKVLKNAGAGGMPTKPLADTSGVPIRTAERCLKRLQEAGRVDRKGESRNRNDPNRWVYNEMWKPLHAVGF